MKLIICPITLIISDLLIWGIDYTNIYQPIIVGVILAVLAHTMELFLLKRETFWTSNIADLIAAFAVVYLSQFFIPDARVTLLGALLAALLLFLTEYFQHLYLLRSGKVKKAT